MFLSSCSPLIDGVTHIKNKLKAPRKTRKKKFQFINSFLFIQLSTYFSLLSFISLLLSRLVERINKCVRREYLAIQSKSKQCILLCVFFVTKKKFKKIFYWRFLIFLIARALYLCKMCQSNK